MAIHKEWAKRPSPKQRKPSPAERVVKDVVSGFGELKRQSGIAVEKVKEGVRRIKQSVRR